MVFLDHSSRGQFIMARKLWWLEPEVAGDLASPVRKQRDEWMLACLLARFLSFSVQDPSLANGAAHI